MASLMNLTGNQAPQATHRHGATALPQHPSSRPSVVAPAACARSTRHRRDANSQRRAPAALQAAQVVVDKPPPSVESDSEDKDDFAQPPPEIFTGGRGHETDYVVVGSGIGGLCTAAMLAKYGYKVTVCEAHYHAGGAAHGFDVKGYKFDAGPSFFLGLTGPRGSSSSPLKQVLDAVSETVETKKYKKWICYTPGGRFEVVANRDDYLAMIGRQGGPEALAQWLRLEVAMRPLQQAAGLFPAAAMRADPGVILTSARFLGLGAAGTAMVAGTLTGPFSAVLDRACVTNPWLRSFMDLECFVLSGMTARETLCAEMVYMFAERNAGRNAIEYPIGGSAAIVAALVRGIEKFGGRVMLRTPVEQIMVENGKATGVLLGSAAGRQRMQRYPRPEIITAKRGVISNASVWDTQRLLPQGAAPEQWRRQCLTTPQCDSFVHLHLGINAEGLPADLECHHLVVNSWDDLTAPQNVCIASIPTVFDPSMAPPGKAVVHAYYAANEPYSKWEGVDRNSKEYRALKEQRAEPLWKALERFIPDVRERAELVMVGTPLTHERFLRRSRGSYGPAISASGGGGWPGPKTPVPGLYVCGDSCMPGIGVPAAAASGLMCANTLAPVWSHLGMMSELLG